MQHVHITNDTSIDTDIGLGGLEELEEQFVRRSVFVASLAGFA